MQTTVGIFKMYFLTGGVKLHFFLHVLVGTLDLFQQNVTHDMSVMYCIQYLNLEYQMFVRGHKQVTVNVVLLGVLG